MDENEIGNGKIILRLPDAHGMPSSTQIDSASQGLFDSAQAEITPAPSTTLTIHYFERQEFTLDKFIEEQGYHRKYDTGTNYAAAELILYDVDLTINGQEAWMISTTDGKTTYLRIFTAKGNYYIHMIFAPSFGETNTENEKELMTLFMAILNTFTFR